MSGTARAQQIDYSQPYLMLDQPDVWQPYVGATYAYDDNLLRIPTDQTINGESDTSWTRTVGLGFNRTYSRQQITANFDAYKTSFDRFNVLDYTGKDASLNWGYGITDYITGNVSTNYSYSLTPFTQFHSEELNLRKQGTNSFSLYFHATPSWQVYTSATDYKLRYELVSQQPGNLDIHTYSVGGDYVSAAGNTIGAVLIHEKGEYPLQQLIGTEYYNNDYQQNTVQLKMDWSFSGKTHIAASVGRVRRTFEQFPVRDASGPSANFVVSYVPTGKTSIIVTTYRNINASDNLTVQYSVNKGFAVSSIWDPADKIRIQSLLKQDKYDYTNSALVAALLPQDRIDTIKSASISATYTANRRTQCSVTFYIDKLTSTLSEFNYRDKGMVVNARMAF